MAPNPVYELLGLPTPKPAAPVAPPLTFSLPAGVSPAMLAVQAAPLARRSVRGVLSGPLGAMLLGLLGKLWPLVVQAILEAVMATLMGKGANRPGDPLYGAYLPSVAGAIADDKE